MSSKKSSKGGIQLGAMKMGGGAGGPGVALDVLGRHVVEEIVEGLHPARDDEDGVSGRAFQAGDDGFAVPGAAFSRHGLAHGAIEAVEIGEGLEELGDGGLG